jgi:hypothetical protein
MSILPTIAILGAGSMGGAILSGLLAPSITVGVGIHASPIAPRPKPRPCDQCRHLYALERPGRRCDRSKGAPASCSSGSSRRGARPVAHDRLRSPRMPSRCERPPVLRNAIASGSVVPQVCAAGYAEHASPRGQGRHRRHQSRSPGRPEGCARSHPVFDYSSGGYSRFPSPRSTRWSTISGSGPAYVSI